MVASDRLIVNKYPSPQGGVERRTSWIDLLEAMAIFFVVAYHSTLQTFDFLSNGTWSAYLPYFIRAPFSTCVPVFFFCNGYLRFKKQFCLGRHIRLTLRMFFLTCIWGVLLILILAVFHGEWQALTLRDVLRRFINLDGIGFLWYMGALVCVYLLFPLLKFAYDKHPAVFFYFFAVCFVLTIGNNLLNIAATTASPLIGKPAVVYDFNFFGMFNVFRGWKGESLTYFCLGGIAVMLEKRLRELPKQKRNMAAAAGLFVSSLGYFAFAVLCSKISGAVWDIVYSGYATFFTFLNVCFLVLLAWNYQKENRLIQAVSKNTLGIYYMHAAVFALTKPVVTRYPALCTPLGNALHAAAACLICLLASLAIKRAPVIRNLLK